ncbi:vacuolar protein sorting-associated protein 13 isoform X3 [Apis mellifera]|uniref:Vacuolar protein sorting-associated protein 13 isoform X3 n=1 Tax=Apis mellifera TaxID=7460 RepID=A0A7M7MMQ3_APIME|nr:vacuolar protein sorting-associated protein 13 isoform X3 [Apis mellifera]|eukprot:XP_026298323.1 vacuolar protein sorting-associated protein 13 isoform X3 [Apis mellifera]
MVFESIVAELLNKVLGEYIQNLDHTQLKLSLWGGDVVLTDLLIKETALDVLNLPIRLEYGRLGKLILKIPFKDMWNGQIDAIVEELYLLIVPSNQIAYDAEKEEKIQLEAKRAALARIEKKKQLVDIKSQEKLDDSMVEKLIARMIKNIHIEIKKIHVRYEDHTSFKDHPFSVGFTLNIFTLESCTDTWEINNLKDMYAIPQIYKLCTLDGLAVYLNTTIEQFSHIQSKYADLFYSGIATIDYNPPGYQYLLGPINVNAKLKLNPKPETDGSNYKIPKVWLDMEMQKLRVGLAKKQYHTLVQLGEGLDQAQKAAPYRKYRPNLTSYRGYYKQWWKFAYICVLEETVRRKRRNWDWNHMKKHRDMCRSYAEAYKMKLTTKKIPQEIEELLTECEKKLDIFNLVIIRQKIEMEVEKLVEKEKTLKAKRGWFGFLWSNTQTEETEELNSAAAIMRKFEEAMTPQEKEKLYRAIDYQENGVPVHYPETYEMIDTRFLLYELQIIILDTDKEYPCIIDLQLHSVEACFKSRPSANAILVTASINEMKLLGTKQDDYIPSLFNSHQHGTNNVLISVSYEKNPLDKLCGDRIIVKSKSVDIIYDAQTVIELINLFKVQNSSTLYNLQAAAAEQLEGLKEMSALGLEHAIQKHSVLDIQVNMQASQLIIPHDGRYNSTKSLLIIDLGSLQIHSLEKPKDVKTHVTVKQLISMGKSEEDVLLHLREHSYDKFVLKIVDFQVLVSLPGEEWRTALSNIDDSMTLLHPTTLEIQFHKCLVTDDPLLAKFRLIGQLPSVVINITDIRLLQALSIAQSIPFPKEEEPIEFYKLSLSKSVSQLSLLKDLTTTIAEKKKIEDSSVTPIKQTTDMEMRFEMKEFAIQISSQKDNEIIPFMKFEILQLEAEMLQRTYDKEILLRLGGIQIKQHYNQREIFMVNTPMLSGRDEYLITVQYVNVNKRSPEFKTKHGSVLQLLKLEFTTLDIWLHQEALINLLQFISYIQDQMNAIANSKLEKEPYMRPRLTHLVSIQEETTTFLREQIHKQRLKSMMRRKKTIIEDIDLKIQAKVGTICMKITSDCREITAFYIDGISAGYIMKSSHSQANVNLSSINIKDLNVASAYRNIVSVTEDTESLQIQAIIYNVEPSEIDKNNMSITVVMGCYRIVFLNMFVTSIMSFLNNFQAAQQAIKEASAAAAEAAKINIKDARKSATRIGLAIKIKAPVIYVPMHSTSDHCLTLDMGNLTICNIFKKLEITNEVGDFPIIDEMRIELQNFKLSRVRLNIEKFVVQNEILLLEPVSFTLLIKRNLSSAWFTSIPDIDMSGRLNKINILISKEDYITAMKVLEKNLGETVEDKKFTASVNKKKVEIEVLHHRPDKFVTIAEDSEDSDLQEQVHIHTSIKFEFVMDSLVITLFMGGSKMLQSQNSLLHLPENGLAKFCLTHFALKGRIFADGLMATSILLMNCTLDDIRQSRQGSFIRIMERITTISSMNNVEEESKPVRSMLDMTIRQSSNDTFVDIRVFSFSIIVSLDYLMKIKDFFTIDNLSNKPVTQHVKSYSEPIVKKKQIVSPTKKMFTINIHIEKPDIILLEDMDDINSNCIILNTELLLKVRLMDEHQVITGTIKDLSILAGIYNPVRRSDWIYQVLRPCSISVAGSTPDGKGLHVDICCTDIHLSVSPGVIEILNKVIHTVTKTEIKDQEIIITEQNYEGLWIVTPFEENDFWFLKTEVGIEAIEDFTYSDDEDIVYKPQLAIISAPTILFTLEAGVGNKTLPMLLLHIGFQSNIYDWSTKTMSIEYTMSVIMAYYNNQLALWEPLIEPIERIKNEKRVSTPWELKVKIQFNDISANSRSINAISPTSDSETEEFHQTPKISIDILSTENLEITLTKTCLNVLKQLGNAFSSAMEITGKVMTKSVAPYVLKNETGLAMILDLERSHFKVFKDGLKFTSNNTDSYMEVILESGASVELVPRNMKTVIPLLEQLKSETIQERNDDKFIISFKEIHGTLAIPVLRADKRYFSLRYRKDNSEEWGIVSDVVVDEGSTIVTLRSILQVHNHFNQPISVYYMTKRGNEVECVGTVAPDSKLNLPLDAVYTPTNVHGLFFSIEGYMVSEQFIWKDLQKTISMTKLLKCEARIRQEIVEPFYIKMFFVMIVVGSILYNNNTIGLLLNAINWRSVFSRFIDCIKHLCLKNLSSEHKKYLETPIQVVGEIEQVYFENTSRYTMASTIYNVHLYPSIYLKNFLPINIIINLPGSVQEKLLEAGTSYQIPTIDPGKSCIIIKLPNYLEKDWSCKGEILANPPEFSVWSFESFDSAQKVIMDLGMHTSYEHGSIIMALYCPFWMLNKTGLMLSYRSGEDYLNVLYHPENFKGPILFSFRSKVFFGKKKAMIRVEDGEWSDKFPIDVAGSDGVVTCKYNGLTYQIGVHNQLTYNSLTKQITFTPYYVLINNSDYLIECQEGNRPADPMIKVPPRECTAFWPRSDHEQKLLKARIAGDLEKTVSFIYTESHTTLLKLNNKYGGINVDVQISEGGIYISLSVYNHGNAPALIINHTPHTINFWEKGSLNIRSIQTYNKMFYTWENPAGPRKLIWEDGNKKEIEETLRKDTLGIFHLPDLEEQVFYVSFLDGTQRVLLFTSNMKIAEDCQLSDDFEVIEQEVSINIHGVGLSLVNNITRSELLYMCIASSGIIWEIRKSINHRWRSLSTREVNLIEEGYQKYMRELQIGKNPMQKVILEPKLEVDYLNMEMLKPNHRYLRRTFQTGLWLQYRTSVHQVQLHAKINRLQIDNQLADCIFPVILAPVPPPKSVTNAVEMKPFAELSMIKRLLVRSNVQQFRYFKVLIQEFHVKVDIVFINAIMELLETNEMNDVEENKLFKLDVKLVDEPLMYHVRLITTAEQKNFFDLLHFSPLKIHISFSMTGGNSGPSAMPHVLNVLLQGIGVTLTDIHDIVFKLAYFEREYIFMTHKQLIHEATLHYVGQAIKQAYVLVLGLDVIGNPYGLVVGTMKGIEDLFYEPFHGAIQGPGEFAEGLILGVRSMVGHTVGGMAGAVSKITGAMGKGIAALTFDRDYQRKRQEQLNIQPATLQEGLARSGKGLVMGVFDGVTGVVMKPISGAKEEGVEGFFKGFGKGMVGLVTRPTAGVIDFASGSFDAVKRATELNEEVKKVRPCRFLQPDNLVRPYVREHAEGHKILNELEKGKYSNTDIYFYHLYINRDVLLLTDKRIAYLEHSDLFGGWRVHWTHTWQEISELPKLVDKGVQIFIKDISKKKKLGLFGSADQSKIILIPDYNIRQLLCNKIQHQINQCGL